MFGVHMNKFWELHPKIVDEWCVYRCVCVCVYMMLRIVEITRTVGDTTINLINLRSCLNFFSTNCHIGR